MNQGKRMTSVRVAVRIRPLNDREKDRESPVVVEVHGNKTVITNNKIPLESVEGDNARKQLRTQEFTFDHSFWSVDPEDPHFVDQEQVYHVLGEDVVSAAFDGYNLCVFAYGQTGSGKSHTMAGPPDNPGFIPRFCQNLFSRMKEDNTTYKVELSYLEIYMGSMKEDIRDLLSNTSNKKLMLRNHPQTGPYVEGLSKHTVTNYDDIERLLEKGNSRRVTASTKMNDTSSRSHAVFTIFLSQGSIINGMPSGKQSKIHLVDLAGSENARAAETTGQRLKEGAGINKSLLALKQVIRRLATCNKGGKKESGSFINYRNSDLTFLLKDSLGGNSKTVMIATISPSESCYEESISTLRYARDAKRIINQPTVNEDQNVRLIRELREEIARLTAQLNGKDAETVSDNQMQEKLHENQARIKVLTEEWFGKWSDSSALSKEEGKWELRREGKGLAIDSELPHLIRDDIFTTGIYIYPLKEEKVILGQEDEENPPYIVLEGEGVLKQHCAIEMAGDHAMLHPFPHAYCTINNVEITAPAVLKQGDIIMLGMGNRFRYNHPQEAARLKAEFSQSTTNLLEMGRSSQSLLALPQSALSTQSLGDLYLCRSSENLAAQGTEMQQRREQEQEMMKQKRKEVEEMEEMLRLKEDQRASELQQLEQEVERKQRHLCEVEAELETARLRIVELEKGQDAEGDAARIRSLLEEEKRLLAEAEAKKQQLEKEVEELQRRWEQQSGEMEGRLGELRRHEVEKHRELAALDQDIASKYQAQSLAKDKEQAKLEQEKVQVKQLRHQLFLEQERLTAGRAEVQEKLQQLERAENQLAEKYDRLEREHGLDWKKRFTELSEEDKGLEEAWVDFKEEEAHYHESLQSLPDNDVEGRRKLESDHQELEATRVLLEQERKKMVEKEKELEEEIERETRRWELMKKSELEMLQNERAKLDLKSEATQCLEKEIAEREAAVQVRQSKLLEQEEAVIQMEIEARRRLEQIREEHKAMQEERQRMQRQLRDATQEMDSVKCQMQTKMEEIDQECEEKIKEVRKERERLQSLHGKQIDSEESSQAAVLLQHLEQEQARLQRELEEATARLEDMQGRFEDERDEDQSNLDNVFYQLKDLEHSEKINALVEQELRARQVRDRVEQSRWVEQMEQEMKMRAINERKQILESRSQDKQEILRLRQMLRSLHGKFTSCSMENLDDQASQFTSSTILRAKSSSPVYSDGTDLIPRKSSSNSSSSSGKGSRPKACIVSVAVRGYAGSIHHEYEVKMSAGEETWTIFRRYRSFREMHQALKQKYPQHMNILVFPPKKVFSRTEKVVAERRVKLENYLNYLLELGRRIPNCPLHPAQNAVVTKQAVWDFDPFFRVGSLENAMQQSS